MTYAEIKILLKIKKDKSCKGITGDNCPLFNNCEKTTEKSAPLWEVDQTVVRKTLFSLIFPND